MGEKRQIKIKYGDSIKFVYGVREAMAETGISGENICFCLQGKKDEVDGYTFTYAQQHNYDAKTRDIKDPSQQVKRTVGKKIKVYDTETGEEKIYDKIRTFADESGISTSAISRAKNKDKLLKDRYKVTDYTLLMEEEDHYNRQMRTVSNDNTLKGKLGSLLAQVKYDKFEAIKPKQIREVLPFKKWINDTYYSGPDAIKLYPYWKQFLSSVFDEGANITEVVMGGSIGTGKTTASLYGMMYKLYTLSCYENTAGLFNLMITSKIAMMYFTINLKQAEKLGYGQLKTMIDSVPYFQENFPRNQKLITKLQFPENVEITFGSNSNHAIGLNLIASLLDEANFFNEGKASDERTITEVYNLYSSIVARGRSRYLHNGWNHSICFLVSSSTHKGSFTEKRIEEGRRDDFKHMRVATPRLWDVKPKGTYSEDRFYVFAGNDSLDSLIINTMYDLNNVREALLLDKFDINMDVEEGCLKTIEELEVELVIPIPTDFRKDFENDILKALQDIAGYSTSPSGYLFTSRPTYNKCIDENYNPPFTKDEIEISTNTDVQLWDFLKPRYYFADPYNPHFISVDASTKNDSTGISMVHIKEIKEDVYGNRIPIIQVDFMMRITPPNKPYEIDISKIREFIRYLRDTMGLNIAGVSYDQYASVESLQILKQLGFNAIHQSVIKSDAPHRDLVHLINEGRLITYSYKPFEEELYNMMHDRVKHKVFIAPGTTEYHGDTYMSLVGALMHLMKELPTLSLTNENLTSGEDTYEDRDAEEMMDSLLDSLMDDYSFSDFDDLY